MLVHQSKESYEAAASNAAKHARDKLEGLIETGRASGTAVIEKVIKEVPTDRIVRGKLLKFAGDSDGIEVNLPRTKDKDIVSLDIHNHALNQVCGRVNFPWKYAQYLREEDREDWGSELLAENLTQLYQHNTSRYLLRSYDDQLRGFLSDRFRRLDSRPLVEAFATACQQVGAVPVQGYATDTKVALKALLQKVYEPVTNEILAFGVCWENSDYGNGAHSIRAFVLRLWCTNYAIADEGLRQVHLGRRLTENVRWSQSTYELDTKTTASAIGDVVNTSLGSLRIAQFCETIKKANEEKIDPKKAIAKFRKQLTKGEVQQITETFNSPDVETLPPGNTTWRLSNAISWIAGKTEDTERKLDLMKVAGSVIQS